MRVSSPSRGVALLVVILTVALLLAIALPFLFSMAQQEKGARSVADRVHARYAASAARSRAIAATAPGHELLEEKRGAANPFNTPYHDAASEFSSGRAGRRPAAGLESGALVADEQGKLNVRTAPPGCVERLKKRLDLRVDDARDYVTEASGRAAAWVDPQTLRKVHVDSRKPDEATLWIDDDTRYSPGARVRVRSADASAVALVLEQDELTSAFRIAGKGVAKVCGKGALMELELRHPVNVNTASREVLAACLEGLELKEFEGKDRVSRAEAELLAARMAKRTFEEWEELEEFFAQALDSKAISDADFAAILLNAETPTHRRLIGTGTAPFSLQSWNFVTVASRGVRVRDNRTLAGESDLRDIVELAPPGTLTWRCRSQQDFEDVIGRGMSRGFATGPAFAWETPVQDRNLSSWLTGKTGRDHRADWPIKFHFDEHNEGKEVGDGLEYTGLAPFQTGQLICWPSGAAEMWIQAPRGDAVLFEAGDELWSNRIALTYEGTSDGSGARLRLSVKDATLEKGLSQIVAKVTLVAERWYHVGAYWKSTRNGGMLLTLDGLPVGDWRCVPEPYAEMPDFQLGTPLRLVGELSKDATEIPVKGSTGTFPPDGAICIGQEIIEYEIAAVGGFQRCRRGSRGSRAFDHPAGSTVALWGYTSYLRAATLDYSSGGADVPVLSWDRIPKVEGTLTHGFGTVAQTTTGILSPNPLSPPEFGFTIGETVLEVAPGLADPFPKKGWLAVGKSPPEIVHYTDRRNNRFTGLTRALFGTKQRNHYVGDPITLFGFYVSSNEGYPDPTVLCLDKEFIGPVRKVGKNGWVGLVEKRGAVAYPWPLYRAADWGRWSFDSAHDDGVDVTPTFTLEDPSAGGWEPVTIVQKDKEKREPAVVACSVWMEGWKGKVQPPALRSIATTTNPPFNLVALNRHLEHEVVADDPTKIRRYSRILRFPSGELPYSDPQPFRAGTSIHPGPEPLPGRVDELRFYVAEYPHYCLARPISATDTEIVFGMRLPDDPCGEPPPIKPMPPPEWVPGPPVDPPPKPEPPPEPYPDYTYLDPKGGAILVDDEVIGYVEYDASTRTLKGLKRGYLGTIARGHAKCGLVYPLTFLAIAATSAAAWAETDMFPVTDTDGFPEEGYFLVDKELVGWTKVDKSAKEIGAPEACEFRGAFGTRATPHDKDSLLYAMPWRYYDRYTRCADDSDLHWFESTLRASGSRWKSIRWEEAFTDGWIDLHVFVRFNAEPRWIHLPVNPKRIPREFAGRFYEFADPRGGKIGDTMADQIDVRVMFEYLDGAYEKGEWKRSVHLRGFDVLYEQPNVVHRHEE